MKRVGKFLLLRLFALLLGAAAGGFVLLFLKLMKIGIAFFWETLPAYGAFAGYPIVVCGLGGIAVGLCQKYIGPYPETMEKVLETVKEMRQYGYKKIPGISLSSLLPIVFGGSVGPEAGLTGIISSLCTWVGDCLRRARGKMEKLAAEKADIPRKAKRDLYALAVLGGFGVYFLLNEFLGGGLHIARFGSAAAGLSEALWSLPLLLFGAAAGYFYFASGKAAALILKPLARFAVLRAVIGGVLLGICGAFFPYTMFSGELQMGLVMENWAETPMVELFLIGVIKIVIVNVCIQSGWKGGPIFPVLFSGVCLGYGTVFLTGIDSVFSVVVTTAAFCGAVLRKPAAVILVLLFFFPVNSVPYLIIAAFIGSRAPIPAAFKTEQ